MISAWALPLIPTLGAAVIIGSASRSAAMGVGGQAAAEPLEAAARRRLGRIAVGVALVTLLAGIGVAATQAATSFRWSDRLSLELASDGFARVMVILVPLIGVCVLAYASAEEEAAGLPRLLALLCAFLGAMELLVLANDFLTLLIGFELVGACSWALIGHHWRDRLGHRAANHAFLVTRFGDLGLFIAAGAAFSAGESLSFSALESLPPDALNVVAGGVLLAAAAKSAQLPFSPWLFSAMRGPTPVSALLHSATMVAAGAYVLIRLAPAFEPTGWFGPTVAGIGLATAIAGGVVAALHTEIKKVLAASTSAQYGLMFVAVGAGSAAASSLHLVAHAAFKALLFLGAGIAIHAAGTGDLRRMRLGSSLREVRVLFAIGALALAAVPPLGGSFTKEAVVDAASARSLGLGLGVLIAGLLSALYAGRVQLLAFGRGEAVARRRPGLGPLVSLGILALVSIALGGLWLPIGEELAGKVLGSALPHGPGWAVPASLASVATGLGLVWWLGARGALVTIGLRPWGERAADAWLGLGPATGRGIADLIERLSNALAVLDDRAVDAGIRAAVRTGSAISRLSSTVVEIRIDAVVRGIARCATALAYGSRMADDRGLDAAAEGVARGVGAGGRRARQLQSGFVHHYYVLLSAGFAVAVLVLLWLR